MLRFITALLLAALLSACGQRVDESRILLTEEELQFIARQPEVIYALEDNRPPYIYISKKDGAPAGLAIEYLNLISKKVGLKFKPARTGAFNTSLEHLIQGNVDVMFAIRPTPALAEQLNFTPPFTYQGGVFIFRANTFPRSPLTVAMLEDGPAVDYITARFPEMKIIEAHDDEEAMSLLNKGLVDGCVTDAATAKHLAALGGVQVRGGIINFDYPYTIAYRKDHGLLGSILNKAIASISPKEKDILNARVLGEE